MTTPSKNPHGTRTQISEICRVSENFDPNLPSSSPCQKPMKSPAVKSAKTKKSAPKTPNRIVSSPPLVQERKFIVAKKKSKRAEKDIKKCRQIAYEALRASQEVFFRQDPGIGTTEAVDQQSNALKYGEEKDNKARVSVEPSESTAYLVVDDLAVRDLEGSSKVRKMRSIVMEAAMSNIPEPGSGRVMHLVKAFESLLSIPKDGEGEKAEESKRKVMNWALPGLQRPPNAVATEVSSSSVFSSAEFFPSWVLERGSRVCSSMDSNDGRLSCGSRTSGGRGRRSRRNSFDSSRRSWNKKLKVTSQQPFKLRTEQRGRLKEEHFFNKVKEMLMEEEKQRIPIAQGLPWTTDEPENLVKPPVKETTEPIDLVLHSDVRAVERAEFDVYVSERMSFADQMKLERERQRKLEEEEELRRLRRELVPRAQPMPFFDRPFIPKKSTRPRTVPKEPRFHSRPLKACVSMLGS